MCLAFSAVHLITFRASAEDNLRPSMTTEVTSRRRHTVYFETATMLLSSAFSANYDYLVSDHFSLRAGIGGGYYALPITFWGSTSWFTGTAIGAQVTANLLLFGPRLFLEVGLGVAPLHMSGDADFEDDWVVAPAVDIAFRIQQPEGGFSCGPVPLGAMALVFLQW